MDCEHLYLKNSGNKIWETLAATGRRKQSVGTGKDVTCTETWRCAGTVTECSASPTVELFLGLERNPLEGVRKLFKGFFFPFSLIISKDQGTMSHSTKKNSN